MDLSQYMGMFLEESREHLQTLNRCLLDLEHDPSDLSVLDEIFRSAHTIKGMSATMGFTTVAELTHEMENVLDLLRKGQLKADHSIIDTVFKCVDTLEQLVENIASGDENGLNIKPLIARLKAIASGESAAEAVLPAEPSGGNNVVLDGTELEVAKKAKAKGLQTFGIDISLREGCLLKSARAYMAMSALEELGDVIKSTPPVEDLEKENFGLSFQVILVTDAEADKVQQMVLGISEIEAVEVRSCDLTESQSAPAAEAAAPAAAAKEVTQPESAVKQPVEEKREKSAAVPVHVDKKLKGGQSVRVDIDKLDNLLNLVGELVINKTRLEQIGLTHRLTDLVETIEQMDRVTTDLQTVVMKVRMVPVGQVFNRFPRMVRDLSRDLNKEVNLIIQGEETELDRTVIDEIGDPLVHLLRNAIDHGIDRKSVV